MAEEQPAEGEDVRGELESLLDRLDDASLRFLKQQAEILIYSSELEEARRKAAEAARNLKRPRRGARGDAAADDGDAAGVDSQTGEAEAGELETGEPESEEAAAGDSGALRREPPVSIIRRSETSFLITVTGTRVFFNRQEMREMTRIAHAASDAADGARRLHRWLARERSDFLKDTGAERAGDPRLGELWSVIVSTYRAD
jgi:hypothetical protein